jgi:tetratricopeptide (TPR) repeat protein
MISDPGGASPTPSGIGSRSGSDIVSKLQAGSAFGSRYRILHRLGEGGMGVVFQAWDEELGIPVALKLIRPEKLVDAHTGQEMERRFKRELVLARQVTHKNVVRIHDLGELKGVKYFTMPFVEGHNLASILAREGKMTVARTLRIARQVAAGLAAAHERGIIHRDLKPENVMLDADELAIIMDFGLARSSTTANLTMAGVVVGTITYMAPEQARGEAVDQRADIYSWGLMVYDMLVGRRRSGQHRDAMSEMFARMHQAPAALRTLEPAVPEALEKIVARAIDPNPANRFASIHDVIVALDNLDAEGYELSRVSAPALPAPPAPSPPAPAEAPLRRRGLMLAGASALLIATVGIGWWLLNRPTLTPPVTQHEPMSVLVADFQNKTGDPVFDGSLEHALSLGVEGASFITAFPRRDAERVAGQIRPNARLDEEMGRLVCQREGIKTMLVGTISSAGSGYDVSVRVIDPVPGSSLATATRNVRNKADVLAAIGDLSATIRTALGDATPESAMAAASDTFTTTSLEAARDYAEARSMANAGRDEEAILLFQKAIARDEQMGRAYAGWAASAFKLGRRNEAELFYQRAFALVDRMTEREKLRTYSTYYLNLAGNYERAIETNLELAQKYPSDGAALNNLALAYFNLLQFDKALEHGKHVLDIHPQSALYRYNYALYAMYAGDFTTAASEGRRALEANPNLPKAHLAIAMSALANGNVLEARTAYSNARATGPLGVSLANIGLADLEMHQGRFEDAVGLLATGLNLDEQTRNSAGAAAKAIALAEAHVARGGVTQARESMDLARKIANDPSVAVPLARLLLQSGRPADVAAIASQLEGSLAPRSVAYGKVVQAMAHLDGNRPREALDALQEAQKLADLWLVRFYKGVAYVALQAYPDALSELELCEKRRGEATAVFLDDVPTFRYVVPLSYWLGRAHDGLGARDAATRHFKAYLALRSPTSDPLAKDAAVRVGRK